MTTTNREEGRQALIDLHVPESTEIVETHDGVAVKYRPGPHETGGSPLPPRAPRRRARRILWFRWYGFPKRSEAAWHLRQLGKHLRSLVGLRP